MCISVNKNTNIFPKKCARTEKVENGVGERRVAYNLFRRWRKRPGGRFTFGGDKESRRFRPNVNVG